MTQLVPQSTEIRDTDDLAAILARLTDAKPDAKAVQSVSKARNTVAVTETAMEALEALSGLLRAVTVPSERREATPQERADMMRLAKTAKQTVPAITAAVEEVKEAIFNHFDLILEAQGGESLPRNEDGHYLVKDEVFVPEEGMRFTRELAQRQAKVNVKKLRDLWKEGKISRRDYFEATQHVEVPREIVDENLASLLKRKPQLLAVIKDAVEPGTVTASFHVREPKKD